MSRETEALTLIENEDRAPTQATRLPGILASITVLRNNWMIDTPGKYYGYVTTVQHTRKKRRKIG